MRDKSRRARISTYMFFHLRERRTRGATIQLLCSMSFCEDNLLYWRVRKDGDIGNRWIRFNEIIGHKRTKEETGRRRRRRRRRRKRWNLVVSKVCWTVRVRQRSIFTREIVLARRIRLQVSNTCEKENEKERRCAMIERESSLSEAPMQSTRSSISWSVSSSSERKDRFRNRT